MSTARNTDFLESSKRTVYVDGVRVVRMFRNTENGELYTLPELEKMFAEWLEQDASEEEREIYNGRFGVWLNACMAYNNGVLDEVRR